MRTFNNPSHSTAMKALPIFSTLNAERMNSLEITLPATRSLRALGWMALLASLLVLNPMLDTAEAQSRPQNRPATQQPRPSTQRTTQSATPANQRATPQRATPANQRASAATAAQPAKSLKVVSVSPALGAVTRTVSDTVTIRFSTPVDRATMNAENILLYGEVNGFHRWRPLFNGNDQISLVPLKPFLPGERISVIVTDRVKAQDKSFTATSAFTSEFRATSKQLIESGYSETNITSTSIGVRSLHPADFDRDGIMDVAGASNLDNKISWHRNPYNTDKKTEKLKEKGKWVFEEKNVTRGAMNARAVAAADIDGNGTMDMVSGSNQDDKVAWYPNINGAIAGERIISTRANGVLEIATADVDLDGDIDVLSSSDFDRKLAWYKNDGKGAFQEYIISTDYRGIRSIHAADVDKDGDVDILAAAFNSNEAVLFVNDGAMNFTPKVIASTAEGIHSVFAADLDRDGNMDVVAALSTANKVVWYRNDGRQNFTEMVISDKAVGALVVFPIDVDGDGDTDVIAGALENEVNPWYENDGSGNFSPKALNANPKVIMDVFATDVDGDGDLDVLTASANDNQINWYTLNVNLTIDAVNKGGVAAGAALAAAGAGRAAGAWLLAGSAAVVAGGAATYVVLTGGRDKLPLPPGRPN